MDSKQREKIEANWDNTESEGGSDTNGDGEHNTEACEEAFEDSEEQREGP